jgi:benzoyl-CoA reductase/2-hydroxyglutaryl-CoA dehydratase subunit BcrC/BadD/HgdB
MKGGTKTMLKKYYENMKGMFAAQDAQKPRAFTKISIQLADSFVEAFNEDARVVWTSYYSFPMELLSAFDVTPFDFEIATNLLPTMDPDGSVQIMSRAEEEGYSTDICSYHRIAVGCQLLGYMPRADLLLSSSYFCDGKSRTNELLAHYHGKEAISLDIPNRIDNESVSYVVDQLKFIAGKIAEVSGHKLDPKRLRESIRASNRARKSYSNLAEMQKQRPSPWSGIQAVNMSIFGNLMAGKEIQAHLYGDLVEECRGKLASGKVPPEKFRVIWLAWFPVQPTVINEILRKNGVSIVMGELERLYWDEIDEDRPWEGLAMKSLKNPHVGPVEQRMAGILGMVDEYSVDGVIHFSTDACRHSCAGTHLIGDALRKRNIPYMVLEGDMSDKRKYSEDRTRSMLESFIEVMAARK